MKKKKKTNCKHILKVYSIANMIRYPIIENNSKNSKN